MSGEEVLLVGSVEAIYFENPSNFYKVMRISINQQETEIFLGEEIVVTGQFATIHLDTEYQFFGKITQHPKYGEQFAVERYQQQTPTSKDGIIEYLASDRFKGIGKVLAQRIVDELGANTIERILADGSVLDSIKGLTKAKATSLRNALINHRGTERIFMQLNQWGFGPNLAEKIYRVYESKTIEIIKENPYELIETVDGIGFNKADLLAAELGFEALSVDRLVAGIYVSVYEVSMQEGDTYVPIQNTLNQARRILETSRKQLISEELLQEAVEKAVLDKKLMRFTDSLMLPSLHHAEHGIANRIHEYLKYEQVERFSTGEIESGIDSLRKMTAIDYDSDQIAALKKAINAPMSIITGGPGTGKTTLIKGLILLHSILHEYDLEKASNYSTSNPIYLAAPTGRAAKRMQETTGIPASTIHRLIGFTRESLPDNFHSEKLDGSLIIIDEMSMVDTWLMHWLIQAIPYHMQVVFVGDQDQLPSVGPGKVFSDLIQSEVLPVLSLTKIYRQANDSSIISLAHSIRKGQLPADFLEKKHDRTFITANRKQVEHVVKQIVTMAMKKDFDATNLQVLAPMYKGPAGIDALNLMLQDLLNPAGGKRREITHYDRVLRVGDKVLQLVNNTDEEVYNGDVGRIESIHYKAETESKEIEIVVSFDEKELIYKKSELDQLTLAYCTSIHKAQGSEYPLVILPLVDTFSRLLQKDLLYTAVTRAQSSLIMIGNPNSYYKAVESHRQPRRTFLKENLLSLIDKKETEVDSKANTTADVASKEIGTQLSEENYDQINPMINMEGISPYDFLE